MMDLTIGNDFCNYLDNEFEMVLHRDSNDDEKEDEAIYNTHIYWEKLSEYERSLIINRDPTETIPEHYKQVQELKNIRANLAVRIILSEFLIEIYDRFAAWMDQDAFIDIKEKLPYTFKGQLVEIEASVHDLWPNNNKLISG